MPPGALRSLWSGGWGEAAALSSELRGGGCRGRAGQRSGSLRGVRIERRVRVPGGTRGSGREWARRGVPGRVRTLRCCGPRVRAERGGGAGLVVPCARPGARPWPRSAGLGAQVPFRSAVLHLDPAGVLQVSKASSVCCFDAVSDLVFEQG